MILRRQPKNIIDIGCGNGVNLPLSKTFPQIDYHGLDYAEESIKSAKMHYPEVTFHVGDAFDTKLEDRKFELVILSSVIILYKNISDQVSLLKECKRILTDDGVIVLIVWNESLLLKWSIVISRIIGKIFNQKLPEDFMGVHFKKKDIELLVKKENLIITESIRTGHWYGLLESIRYLSFEKYNRKFGKAESESGKIHSQSIFQDICNTSGNKLIFITKVLFLICKVFPRFFSMFSVYTLQKGQM